MIKKYKRARWIMRSENGDEKCKEDENGGENHKRDIIGDEEKKS